MNTSTTSLAGKLAKFFINSKLTPLIVIATLLLGVFAVFTTPREEEPQIVVPMIDVLVPFPGASSQEVEAQVTKPLEKKLWEIKGVEYLYSNSMPGMALVTARFLVGSNQEDSLVKVYNQIFSNLDLMPPGTGQPLIKLKSIDDVPIVTLTLWSKQLNDYQLRRVGLVVADEIKKSSNISKVNVIGGRSRQVRVNMDPGRLAAYHLSPLQILNSLQAANITLPSGNANQNNYEYQVWTGRFLETADDVANLVVAVYQGHPVYLRDVANIQDGPGEATDYVWFGTGPSMDSADKALSTNSSILPAVTISIAKQKGTNAVWVAEDVLHKVDELKGKVIPGNVQVTVTRNYGESATEKANELIEHLLIATFSVFLLIWVMLGLREAIVVGVAVPVTLAIALFLSEMFGYTLNRVTLFALIFAIGILVDDAIVIVENIHRWFGMHKLSPMQAVVKAVEEVGNPTILATFTVIAVLMPMAYVKGLMGPYMRPIPINASAAMFFSLLVAFIVTPWFACRFLKHESNCELTPHGQAKQEKLGIVSRLYTRAMNKLLTKPKLSYGFLIGIVVLLFAMFGLIYNKSVMMKMLPFDNKSEFQVIMDMPEGSTLEETAKAARAVSDYIATVNEVTNYQIYVGTAAPVNFAGLVRHYDLRQGSNVADIQVNLIDKYHRSAQSHDVAKRVRGPIQQIAQRYGANAKIVEVPPGPPVLSPLVAEIYGPNLQDQIKVAKQVEKIFQQTQDVVDTDIFVEDDQTQYRFTVNKRARLSGITEDQVVGTANLVMSGRSAGLLHTDNELEPVQIVLRAPKLLRNDLDNLQGFRLPDSQGNMVPLSEVVDRKESVADKTIYHKNLQRVVYVVGDVAGKTDSPVYAMLNMSDKIKNLKLPDGSSMKQYLTSQPELSNTISMKWDGEWQITYEVFRDLGAAFAVGLIIMYLMIVGWFQSFKIPLVIMSPIMLTLVGIIPGHWIMGAFFTATSMIGFIALAGIIVRNSILLVEFTHQRIEEGIPLKDALIEAGIVRAQPIILTALAVMVGAMVILFDPIFQGLAISLIFGTLASTPLTLFIVPVLYYLMADKDLKSGVKSSAAVQAPSTLSE